MAKWMVCILVYIEFTKTFQQLATKLPWSELDIASIHAQNPVMRAQTCKAS